MIEDSPRVKLYVQVCEHEKPGVKSCGPSLPGFRDSLKKKVAELGLAKEIRVMRSGCFGVCEEGPNVFLMPPGIWLRAVESGDLEAVLHRALEVLKTLP